MRIGAHGKITRTYLGGGVWVAPCRYRDNDGVTRVIERRGPADDFDKHGKLAEDALVEVDGRAVRTIDTYEYCAKLFGKIMSGVRVGEATPARLDAAIRSMRRAHGDVMAVQSKTILKGGLHLAVMANVIGANPVRDVSPMQSKSRPVGAKPLTADELRGLLTKLRESEACQRHDLVDPITLFIATGLRISELLGLLWSDIDEETSTLKVSGEVIRAAGKGLMRIDETKTAAGRRTIPLPTFAAAVLVARRTVVSGRAGDGVPIDGRHLARSRQLPGTLARDP
ncbi:MAG: tyrosine-type recombinase/integrase [Mycobacterium sp.]